MDYLGSGYPAYQFGYYGPHFPFGTLYNINGPLDGGYDDSYHVGYPNFNGYVGGGNQYGVYRYNNGGYPIA